MRLSRKPRLAKIDEAAQLSGMHPEMIDTFLRARLVTAVQSIEDTPYFDSDGVSRLQRIQYLREHGRVNLRTIRYIVGLLDALAEKERELETLRLLVLAAPARASSSDL